MINLLLKRVAFKQRYTIGHLYLADEEHPSLREGQGWVYICDTIEDTDRGLTQSMSPSQIKAVKVQSQTAIPTGTYKVTLDVISPKFSQKAYYRTFCGGRLPRLIDVPGFDGILMHRGRTQEDSAGCIILGYNKVVGQLTSSQAAFETLYKRLQGHKDIQITIR